MITLMNAYFFQNTQNSTKLRLIIELAVPNLVQMTRVCGGRRCQYLHARTTEESMAGNIKGGLSFKGSFSQAVSIFRGQRCVFAGDLTEKVNLLAKFSSIRASLARIIQIMLINAINLPIFLAD